MKKLMMTALMVLSCGVATALPVGNPGEASLYTNGLWWSDSCCEPCDPCFNWCDMFSLRVGFYGDYVFNRHLEVVSGNTSGSDIDDAELYTNAGILVLNVCDWIDIFGIVGVTNASFFTDGGGAFSNNSSMIRVNFDPTVSWSVGGRATVWHCGCLGVGVEAQYFRTSPDMDNIITYDDGLITYLNANNSTRYSEWQVGLGAAYRWTTGCPGVAFVPYAAIKWADGKWDLNGTTATAGGTSYTFGSLEPKKAWGWALGITATLCDAVGVTVEGRFADEKAVYVNSQIRF